jgi:hypothetical protein
MVSTRSERSFSTHRVREVRRRRVTLNEICMSMYGVCDDWEVNSPSRSSQFTLETNCKILITRLSRLKKSKWPFGRYELRSTH